MAASVPRRSCMADVSGDHFPWLKSRISLMLKVVMSRRGHGLAGPLPYRFSATDSANAAGLYCRGLSFLAL